MVGHWVRSSSVGKHRPTVSMGGCRSSWRLGSVPSHHVVTALCQQWLHSPCLKTLCILLSMSVSGIDVALCVVCVCVCVSVSVCRCVFVCVWVCVCVRVCKWAHLSKTSNYHFAKMGLRTDFQFRPNGVKCPIMAKHSRISSGLWNNEACGNGSQVTGQGRENEDRLALQ